MDPMKPLDCETFLTITAPLRVDGSFGIPMGTLVPMTIMVPMATTVLRMVPMATMVPITTMVPIATMAITRK